MERLEVEAPAGTIAGITTSTQTLDEFYDSLLDSDEEWIETLLSILHKESQEIRDFVLSFLQREYLRIRREGEVTGKRRRVILKPRQAFISTAIQAKNFKDFNNIPGTRVLVVVQSDETKALFRSQIDQWADQLELLGKKPKYDIDNQGMIEIKSMQCAYVIVTAGAKFGGRGGNFNRVHLSEVDFWQGDPHALMRGITPALTQNAEVDIESTANLADGVLHDYYTAAKNGENEWQHIFWRWFDNPEYVRSVPEGFSPTLEELELKGKHGLSLEQLSWRRWMQSEMKNAAKGGQGIKASFVKEYPEDDIRPFIAGGDQVLDEDALLKYVSIVIPFLAEHEGWKFWKGPESGVPYAIGSDPSEGKNDYTGQHIFNAWSKEQVGVYREKVDPADVAKGLNLVGRMYNNALIAVETPGPGTRVNDRLLDQYHYPNLYYYYNDITGVFNEQPGWPENGVTRNILMDLIQEWTRVLGYRIYDEQTLRELASLTWRKLGSMKRARAEAGAGAHDDLVFSLAISLVVCSEAVKRHNELYGIQTGPRAVTIDQIRWEAQMGMRPPSNAKGPEQWDSWRWDGVIPGELDRETMQGYETESSRVRKMLYG